MRDYVIINGVNSLTINGLAISKLPPISKPLMRNKIEEIDGRDGDLITELGYSAYDKEMEIGLFGNFDINQVISFFNGECTITFSNEDDKHYYFKILEQIDYEKLLKFKRATITFHCQPFKYPNSETVIDVDSLTGTGTGTNITLSNTSLYEPIAKDLLGDTSQNGTPTPDIPIEVQTVTGGQAIIVCGKNIFNYNDTYYKRHTNTDVTIENNSITVVNNNTSTNGYVWWNIPVKIGENINISFESIVVVNDSDANRPYYYFVDEPVLSYNTSFFQNVVDIEQSYIDKQLKNKTVISTKKYLFLALRIRNGVNGYTINNLQVEYNTQPTSYEEYIGQSYEINLGKNLFDKNAITENKRIDSSGNPYTDNNYNLSDYIKVEPSTIYTYSKNGDSGSSSVIAYYDINKTYISRNLPLMANGVLSRAYTMPNNCYYVRIADLKTLLDSMQFEKGYKATSYSPYKEQIELCKIGDYQDRIYKENDKWYLHKETDKVVLDGSENWSNVNTTTNNRTYRTSVVVTKSVDSGIDMFSNYFERKSVWNLNDGTSGIGRQSDNGYLLISMPRATITDITAFKEWLTTHNTIVYYILETPTTTELTDETLLAQLNTLNNATGYEGTTNISSLGYLPIILNVSATAIPTTTITNIGNIYAKPLLTIYGSGDISLYLNDIQILQIALGDSGEITIDVSNMEAYNKDTKVLMNRLVTGDYSNFLINSGTNKLLITGDVSNFIMSNYTRWL